MKHKKHTEKVSSTNVPKSILEQKNELRIQRSSFLRFSISLALSLIIVYSVFQIQTVFQEEPVKDVAVIENEMDNVPFFIPEKTEVKVVKEVKPEPQVENKVIYDDVKQVDDTKEIKNTVIDTEVKPKEVTKDFDYKKVEVATTVENPVPVDFVALEEAPVFPGCEKYSTKEERKKCMSEKVQKHVNRKFNTGLARDLNLDSGVQRIFVQFIIDKNGNIAEIKSRASHPKLEKEAMRVINSLPEMQPGKQQNKPVNVRYTLPIMFQVN